MIEQMDGSYDNPFKFNAKELDEDTGLYYYGARYYNPRLSIWYGVDPLANKFPNWSPFTYTFDNPVRYTDPDGMAPKDIIIIGSNVNYSQAKKILMQTNAGRELWNKYSKSKTTDIYIGFGSIPKREGAAGRTANGIEKTTAVKDGKIKIDPKSEISEFKPFDGVNISKSKGKNVALVLLNTNPETGYFSSTEKAQNYHSERSGGKEMNDYDNADVIYHEIKAHVDLAGSKDEHDAYGLSTAGIMRDDIKPKKGSPAEIFKNQLKSTYDTNNKPDEKSKK